MWVTYIYEKLELLYLDIIMRWFIMVSGKYFNKGVMALDAPHIGHVVRETDDKIVLFGHHN